jgi:hypothetical protein
MRRVGDDRREVTMRRPRSAALTLLGPLTILWVVGLATPATAEVLEGGCTGSATFTNGTTVDQSTPLSTTVVVPDGDTVTYSGSINLPPPPKPESFEGGIDVRLPFGGWTVVSWGPDDTETVSITDGTYTYSVPGFVPRGTGGLEVTAIHIQQGQTCKVALTMALEGDPGAAAIIGATGTAVFAAGVIGAGIKKKVA